ncbi:hypothetical protein [Trichocoleus sp. DQ-U1]
MQVQLQGQQFGLEQWQARSPTVSKLSMHLPFYPPDGEPLR